VRWIPPLIVTSEQIDTALAIFGHAFEQIGERVSVAGRMQYAPTNRLIHLSLLYKLSRILL
jgi:hypothetical protein